MADSGIVMEVPSGRIVARGLSMPHSPRLIYGQLYVLEGRRGQVLTIDPATGARRVAATLPGFTHGLTEYGGVLFVGLSKLRDKRGPQGLPIEAESADLVAGGGDRRAPRRGAGHSAFLQRRGRSVRRAGAAERPARRNPESAAVVGDAVDHDDVGREDGSIRIQMPRDRDGSFQPLLIPRHERRFTGFDDRSVAMYDRTPRR
jgi:hypothetical protein